MTKNNQKTKCLPWSFVRVPNDTHNAAKTVTGWTVEERLTPEVRMFQSTFLFHGYHTGNRIIVNIYKKNYFKAGLPKFRAIEYILTTIGACEELQKFGEHEKASTRVMFASNSSKGQVLRALFSWMGPFDTPKAVSRNVHRLYARTYFPNVAQFFHTGIEQISARIRACKQLQKFWEQEHASSHLIVNLRVMWGGFQW